MNTTRPLKQFAAGLIGAALVLGPVAISQITNNPTIVARAIMINAAGTIVAPTNINWIASGVLPVGGHITNLTGYGNAALASVGSGSGQLVEWAETDDSNFFLGTDAGQLYRYTAAQHRASLGVPPITDGVMTNPTFRATGGTPAITIDAGGLVVTGGGAPGADNAITRGQGDARYGWEYIPLGDGSIQSGLTTLVMLNGVFPSVEFLGAGTARNYYTPARLPEAGAAYRFEWSLRSMNLETNGVFHFTVQHRYYTNETASGVIAVSASTRLYTNTIPEQTFNDSYTFTLPSNTATTMPWNIAITRRDDFGTDTAVTNIYMPMLRWRRE